MRWTWIALTVVACAALAGTSLLYWNGAQWQPAEAASGASPEGEAPADEITLSPQAQANLRIVSKPLVPVTFWKTIQLPGQVVDRPGASDRGVVSPVAGVVAKVHHFPGDTVRSGEMLFTVRLLSEAMQLAQTEMFKATQEIEITEDMRRRLTTAAETGGIPQIRITEIDNELRRLAVTQRAYRLELQTRGLTPQQIEQIGTGNFVTETPVYVPVQHQKESPPSPGESNPELFEVQELKVQLGQQVQAGQMLCLLSHHQELYVEGRAFRKELPLLERSIEQGWTVDIEFMEDDPGRWPAVTPQFTIRHISNTIDQMSHTFAFFLPLTNQSRTYESAGHRGLIWRFRPGQRVRLHVRTEQLDDVIVLPVDAVVHEGPETYVFRQSGNVFKRCPVHVVYQDRQHAVVANDWSVPPGVYVAQNAATQLNRALKSRDSGGGGHDHDHDHDH